MSLSFADSREIMSADSRETVSDTASLSASSGRVKRLTMVMAAIFLAGEMAGSGVLALPKAVSDSGWIGVVLIIVCCLNTGYTGATLGKCWIIVEERFSQYADDSRSPYPIIAFRAFGKKMKYLVSFCVSTTLFGVSVVLLLLISQLLQDVLRPYVTMSYCYWILALGGLLLPFTWLGTPKDFWPAAIFALGSIAVACFLTFTQILIDNSKRDVPVVPEESITLQNFAFAFGSILFAFGGAALFPTIQNDMQDRKLFPRSVVITFTILLVLYLPVATSGYFVYRSKVKSNISQNLTQGIVTTIIQSLLAVHMFFAFIIALNPFCQQFEEIFKIPNGLNWKRCLFRSGAVLASVFVALTIPHFGNILALIGGSTITMLTFVFPPLFYLKLCSQKRNDWPERIVPLHLKVYLVELIIIGVIGGCISTWSAISSIISSATFTVPCYVNPNAECYINPNSQKC